MQYYLLLGGCGMPAMKLHMQNPSPSVEGSRRFLLGFIVKNTGIVPIPSFPRDEKCGGGQVFSPCHNGPPFMDRERHPSGRFNKMKPKPILYKAPKPYGESTMGKG
jgi:hypothetical protein